MIHISNRQRDLAVDFLRQFLELTRGVDRDSLRITNLRRRAGMLAAQLERRPVAPLERGGGKTSKKQ